MGTILSTESAINIQMSCEVAVLVADALWADKESYKTFLEGFYQSYLRGLIEYLLESQQINDHLIKAACSALERAATHVGEPAVEQAVNVLSAIYQLTSHRYEIAKSKCCSVIQMYFFFRTEGEIPVGLLETVSECIVYLLLQCSTYDLYKDYDAYDSVFWLGSIVMDCYSEKNISEN